MRVSGKRKWRGRLFISAVCVGAIAVPASAEAATVTVTPSPASMPAPGGTFSFQVAVVKNSLPEFIGGTVETLTDSVYGNLDGRGTCDVPPAKSLPYTCSFPGVFSGTSGATQTNTVTATGVEYFCPTGPDCMGGGEPMTLSYPPAMGSATVSLTAPPPPAQPAPTKRKCKKGFRLKKVKGKRRCVRKKRKK